MNGASSSQHNARYLVDAGAAFCVADAALTPEALVKILVGLTPGRQKLQAMAEAARSVAKPDAAQAMFSRCVEVGALS
jgi:UDP-N-acetylglucosamine--N-acetylmuramyl-(pentapeptide) pyrophosphoryl-undecaprenol N-acetylglucosamine transferase